MSKGTRNRTVRVDAMWDVAAVIAHDRGETMSDVVRRAIADYVDADIKACVGIRAEFCPHCRPCFPA
jgi:hypothetical protein